MTLNDVVKIYLGSNGDATKRLYGLLLEKGPIGEVGMNLLRVCKASSRAKTYRGRSIGLAYDKKDWSIGELVRALNHVDGLSWGWGLDEALRRRRDPHWHILYVDLPAGQVSFHTAIRRDGFDYPGRWDGRRMAAGDRICQFCADVLGGVAIVFPGPHVAPESEPVIVDAAQQSTLDF